MGKSALYSKKMPSNLFDPIKRSFFQQKQKCIVLIGMPGAGKTTIGQILAKSLSWAHVDTDFLLQSYFGTDLETLRQTLGLENFLQAEEKIILDLKLNRCVISTGGSVVYSSQAMHYLQQLGYIIYLQANLQLLQARIQKNPNRGLAIKPGQNIEQVFKEREPLYKKYSQFTITTETTIDNTVREIIQWLSLQQNEKS
ncbi:MAG: homoserine kinase [Desulfonauticus sp.]|nr:homoserine kinase [Desulfonauticus sp.]